eukprot:Gb_25029 [translate_table: standard]
MVTVMPQTTKMPLCQGTVITKSIMTIAIKGEEQHENANESGNCRGIYMCGDVKTLCKQGRLTDAMDMLRLIDQQGIWVNSNTYASLLHICVGKNTLPYGKLVHAHIIQTGFKPNDVFLSNKLVLMYAKCGGLPDARRVLNQMAQPNVVSWTTMITAYARHGHSEEALAFLYRMQQTGVQPNEFTLASVLPACASLTAVEHGKEVHREIIRNGFQYDLVAGSALVDMYVKCGNIENACKVFDKMPERDVVSWNAMIVGYAQNGHVDEAVNFFQEMPERDVISWNAMIAGYAQNGYVDEALNIFQKMPERDVISWSAMIAGYAQNGYFHESVDLFRQMQLTGVKSNSDTFTNVLQACASLAALEYGKEIHRDIIGSGFQSDVYVGSALVDMYAKCGSIENACNVFYKMPARNIVSWNAMIVGYAMHGYGKNALQLFGQMQHSGTNPDHVTFIAVLSACCHAGLVDDGWQYFDCMTKYYHITPVMEHYCCMVDLLGRAGRLDEVQAFIHNIPIKPSAAMWGSLLGACRIHANVELAEYAAEHLFELDPENAAPYVQLSNIYAAAGRWHNIAKVRKLMKDRGVKKNPGCSWIEVNKQVHVFIVGD